MLGGSYRIAICYSCIFSGIDLLILHSSNSSGCDTGASLMTSKLGSGLSLFPRWGVAE